MEEVRNIESRNHAFYLGKEVANWYADRHFVLPEERAFLRDYGEEIRGQGLLDIGVGGGRSTEFLLPLTDDYVGIDYSETMVRAAARTYPNACFEQQDARDLSAYADGRFHTAVFFLNGIDCLSPSGRIKSLQEMHRVLKAGGLVAFSSHNRNRPCTPPWSPTFLGWSWHPVRLLRHVRRYLTGIWNWLQNRSDLRESAEYTLCLDSGNCFSAPMCYVDKESQVRQLRDLGFHVEVIYDPQGETVAAETQDKASGWFIYVGRKTANA